MPTKPRQVAAVFERTGRILKIVASLSVFVVALDVTVGIGLGFSPRDLAIAVAILAIGVLIDASGKWFFRLLGFR